MKKCTSKKIRSPHGCVRSITVKVCKVGPRRFKVSVNGKSFGHDAGPNITAKRAISRAATHWAALNCHYR